MLMSGADPLKGSGTVAESEPGAPVSTITTQQLPSWLNENFPDHVKTAALDGTGMHLVAALVDSDPKRKNLRVFYTIVPSEQWHRAAQFVGLAEGPLVLGSPSESAALNRLAEIMDRWRAVRRGLTDFVGDQDRDLFERVTPESVGLNQWILASNPQELGSTLLSAVRSGIELVGGETLHTFFVSTERDLVRKVRELHPHAPGHSLVLRFADWQYPCRGEASDTVAALRLGDGARSVVEQHFAVLDPNLPAPANLILPKTAEVDWPVLERAPGLPLGVTGMGETALFDPDSSGMLLITGMAGAGKTVLARTVAASGLLRQYDLHIMDTVFQGAEYGPVIEHVRSAAFTLEEAAENVEAILQQVEERQALLGEHGASAIDELPEGVRPGKLMLVMENIASITSSNIPDLHGEPDSEEVRLKGRITTALTQLTRCGRGAGVVLVGTNQRVGDELPVFAQSADVVHMGDTGARTNTGRHLRDHGIDMSGTSYGVGALMRGDHPPVLFRAWFIGDNHAEALRNRLSRAQSGM